MIDTSHTFFPSSEYYFEYLFLGACSKCIIWIANMVLLSFNIYLSSVEAFARGAQNFFWLLGLLLGLKLQFLVWKIVDEQVFDGLSVSRTIQKILGGLESRFFASCHGLRTNVAACNDAPNESSHEGKEDLYSITSCKSSSLILLHRWKLTTIPNVLRQLQLTEGSISVASLRPFLHEFLRTEHFCINSILCNILEFYSTKASFKTDTNF